MGKVIIFTIFACLLFVSSPLSAYETEYTIGLPCLEEPACVSPEIEAFFIEAYRRIGIEPKFAYLPRLRDLEEANNGHINACIGRAIASHSPYKHLIQIKVPVATEVLVAFTTNPNLHITSWEDLASLKVGVVRGSQLPISLCKANGIDAYEANTLKQLYKLLTKSRLDAVVHHLQVGLITARSIGVPVQMSHILHKEMVYHVLNRKHAALAPQLSKIFMDMLYEGTSARILGKWAGVLPDPFD